MYIHLLSHITYKQVPQLYEISNKLQVGLQMMEPIAQATNMAFVVFLHEVEDGITNSASQGINAQLQITTLCDPM